MLTNVCDYYLVALTKSQENIASDVYIMCQQFTRGDVKINAINLYKNIVNEIFFMFCHLYKCRQCTSGAV